MIRFLKGTLAGQHDNYIVLETPAGIGFKVFVPSGSPVYKNSEGDEIQVFTEMIVSENDMSLYGFHNMESVDMFNLLTSVSGIGPKAGMSILGSMPLDQLKRAIFMGDVKELSRAQGVGKKTAERLVVELKDKVGYFDSGDGTPGRGQGVNPRDETEGATQEAIAALISLGYQRQEAFAAVSKVGDEGLSAEEYIKKALKNLF